MEDINKSVDMLFCAIVRSIGTIGRVMLLFTRHCSIIFYMYLGAREEPTICLLLKCIISGRYPDLPVQEGLTYHSGRVPGTTSGALYWENSVGAW